MAELRAVLKAKEWQDLIKQQREVLSKGPNLLRGAYAVIGIKDIFNHFKQSRGPDGSWEPLKASTIARRRKGRGRGGAKPLLDTGFLRQSILPSNSRIVNRETILVFAAARYSGAHNRGFRTKQGGRVPQREFMWLSDRAKTLMLKFIMNKLPD